MTGSALARLGCLNACFAKNVHSFRDPLVERQVKFKRN